MGGGTKGGEGYGVGADGIGGVQGGAEGKGGAEGEGIDGCGGGIMGVHEHDSATTSTRSFIPGADLRHRTTHTTWLIVDGRLRRWGCERTP